jgi:hypothetical protein
MRRFSVRIAVAALLLLPLAVLAKEPVDLQVITKIKQEEFRNSKVMETLFYLTDVYGPRLPASPAYRKAARWCVERLTEFGLENAHLEPWGTLGRGWVLKKFRLELLEPSYKPLLGFPPAWVGGTNGPVSGEPVLLKIDSEEDFEKYRGKLAGAIVLVGTAEPIEPEDRADVRRFTEDELRELSLLRMPGERPDWWRRRAEFRRRWQLRRKLNEFLKEEGVALVIRRSRGQDGTINVSRGGSYKLGEDPAIPTVVLAAEQYNRLARLLEKNIPVKIAAEIEVEFTTDDTLGYNVIAEIPGTDRKLKDQIVMLGAHLDSWHAGTGATDNATGCAVVMEAVRILKAIGVKPRRTIRVALWDAEELGFLGSRGYIKKHFGDRKTMELKKDHARLSVYFNLDNGGGRIRGIYLQGNDAVRPIFEAYLEPFHDMGATTVTIRNTGGTDHLAFDEIGLPGFQFIQDPLDYSRRTHHTNMDVYDHVFRSDLMQASIIMASFVYHAAMRDEMIPRKPLPKPRQPASR